MPLQKLNNVCLPVMFIVGTKYLFKSRCLLILEPGVSPNFYMGWVFIQTGGGGGGGGGASIQGNAIFSVFV